MLPVSEPYDTVARMQRVEESLAKQLATAMAENARLKAELDRVTAERDALQDRIDDANAVSRFHDAD